MTAVVSTQRRTLLFDLDGTLIDSAVGITRCVSHALAALGHPGLPGAELRGWIGPALRVSFSAVLPSSEVEAAVMHYRERFDAEGWQEHTIYDGVADALASLHGRGHRLVVVTAKNEPHARRIIDHLPFGQLVEDVIGATEDGRLSHKPELIGEALGRLDLQPADCIMIGDRYLDIEGANHHGMDSAGVLWGFGSEQELRTAGAGQLLSTPRQLPGMALS